jgi:hypothetical protein
MRDRRLSAVQQAPGRGPQFVQWQTAQRCRQPNCATDLVLDPGHAGLVRTHIGAENVVRLVPQRTRKRADQRLLALAWHPRIPPQHGFPAAVGEPGSGVLERHRPREPHAFVERDIARHAQPPDGGPAGDIVHHQRGPEP